MAQECGCAVGWAPCRSWRTRLVDPAIVAAITVFTALVSQRWSGLDTPDSSFYASLGVFGDEVTDRAYDNSYYWTRLGYIVPVRLLTGAVGTWPGFAVVPHPPARRHRGRHLLVMRRYTCRPSAAFVALVTSLSTVVLGYLGNPYLDRHGHGGDGRAHRLRDVELQGRRPRSPA